MANLNKQTINNLVQLCRIDCSEEEIEAILKDLAKIIAYVEQLQEIDTQDVPPCNQVLEGSANVMRDDDVGETLPREIFLKNVPSQIGGMVRVPPVMKSN